MEQLYNFEICCANDHITLTDKEDKWKPIIDDFAKQVYDGNYKEGQIPLDLYFKTADKLAEAVMKALPTEFAYDNPANALAAQLKANLYQFSGAKSFAEAMLFAELVADEEGNIKPFNTFRKDIEKIHKTYNQRYLNVEYNNTIASAQMALQWRNYEALGVEWLEYRTANDKRVRPKHAELDGLVLRFDSPVWSRGFPPLDWGCRCNAVPADEPAIKIDENAVGKQVKSIVKNPVFENNVGKTGIVYNNGHPYFKNVKGELVSLDAVKNYGMKSVDRIMTDANLPIPIHIDTKENYYSWWSDMIKEYGVNDANFVLKDKLGNQILFDATPNGKKAKNFFRDHILDKEKEKRYEYAANLKDIIESPDEVWMNKYKGRMPTYTYIKYYDGNPIVINTVIEKNLIKAKTMYLLNEKQSRIDNRKGILMYRK